MSSLWSDFLQNNGRLIHKWRHYFPIYEKHFGRFQNRPVTFLEIGTGKGGSSEMWARWLGPLAKVVSIDINPECAAYSSDHVQVRIGNQGDLVFLKTLVEEFGPPDVVLDDGGHIQNDMVASFEFLYPLMPKEAVYLVEDTHTSYWPAYGGGLASRRSFIEYSKGIVDQINFASEIASAIGNSTQSITFYDSVVVFEKAPKPIIKDLKTGGS